MLTLGVVLGTVLLASRVEGNDLMTEDVLSGRDGARYSDGPGVVVADQLSSSPLAVLVASSIDLEELQIRSLGRGWVVDLRHVVDDGTDVGIGPGGPLDIDGSSSSDLGDLSTGGGVLVAGNLVHVGVHGGIDEAVVKALRAGPLDDLWGGGLVLERRVVGGEGGAIDLDGSNVAVGIDGGGDSAENGSNLDLGRHCVGGKVVCMVGEKGVQEQASRSTK